MRPFERPAEEERRGEAVAGHVVAQVDDVAGLLAAEEAVALTERLEHVAVADVRHDDLDPVLAHQLVEAEVRHHRHRDEVDAQVEREDGEDLVAVDRVPFPIDCEHAVAVAVEGDSEVEAAVGHRRACSSERSVAPQPTLMFVTVRIRGDRRSPPLRAARMPVGAMPEYAPFAQSTAILRPDRSLPNRSTMCSR